MNGDSYWINRNESESELERRGRHEGVGGVGGRYQPSVGQRETLATLWYLGLGFSHLIKPSSIVFNSGWRILG